MRLTILLTLGLGCLACAVNGQTVTSTNRLVRSLTLEECIREALERNLRIQIRRLDPEINRYALAASYGIYDPNFVATYNRTYNSTEGRFNPNTGTISNPSTTDADQFTPGIVGVLPYSGLQYDLSGTFTHSRGDQNERPFDDYVAGTEIRLTQPLLKNLWIDAARFDIEVNKKNIKISELDLEEEVRQVVRDVEIMYYRLMFARDDVKVQEKALELARALLAEEKEKVRIGVRAPLDEKQAESQAATALADLIQAQRRLGTAEANLKTLITDRYEAWVNTAVEPSDKLVAVPEPLNLLESWQAAVAKRPDYRQLLLEAEKLGISVKFQKNQLFPELNLFGGYGRNGLDSSREASYDTNVPPNLVSPAYRSSLSGALDDIANNQNPKWNIGFELRVPFNRTAERNRYKSAKDQLKQAELGIRRLHQDILTEVDVAMGVAKGSYARVSATHQAALYAEEALKAEQTKLANGKSTAFNVLQLQKDLTDARSAEISALAEYNESVTLLFYRDGTLLERRKIRVRVK